MENIRPRLLTLPDESCFTCCDECIEIIANEEAKYVNTNKSPTKSPNKKKQKIDTFVLGKLVANYNPIGRPKKKNTEAFKVSP